MESVPMMASYQNAHRVYGGVDASITNLDELGSTSYNAKNNVLSYFNFISSQSQRKQMKYYAVIAIISVALILTLLGITSNGSSAVVAPINDRGKSGGEICEDPLYFKQVLKEEHTQVIGGMIKDYTKKEARFEASGVVYDKKRDVYWVVFDSLHGIGKLSSDLTRKSSNILVHPLLITGTTDFKEEMDSDFEGITHDPDTDIFYLLTESVEFKDGGKTKYHSIIRDAKYDEEATYEVINACVVDYQLASDNKGFEGLNLIKIGGKRYFVGLCEGNHCSSGSKGRESGNGRVVLIEFEASETKGDSKYKYLLDVGIHCVYKWLKEFNLPSYIDFIDYSDFQFKAKGGDVFDVAVISQESSALWIGEAEWSSAEHGPDFSRNDKKGKTYQFPKRYDCDTVFCNVEGVAFSDNNQLVMVSDKAKNGGKQPWVCGEKDQAVHVFKLPQ